MTTTEGTPRRPRLSRALIARAAVELVERDGAAALTMRSLGLQLGVEAMSLYRHVDGREAVLEAAGELLMAHIEPVPPGQPWPDAGRSFARRLRATTMRHPEAFKLIGLRPLTAPGPLAVVESLLASIVADGATSADALVVYRALASYARGYALAEVTGFTVDARTAEAREPLAALPADAFPTLHGNLAQLAEVESDAAFEAGLDAMLVGFVHAIGAPAGVPCQS